MEAIRKAWLEGNLSLLPVFCSGANCLSQLNGNIIFFLPYCFLGFSIHSQITLHSGRPATAILHWNSKTEPMHYINGTETMTGTLLQSIMLYFIINTGEYNVLCRPNMNMHILIYSLTHPPLTFPYAIIL